MLGVSLAGLGCEGDGGLAVLKPKMVLDPEPDTTLAFQEVVITRTEAEPIFIEVGNVGNGPLRVEELRVEGPNAAAFRISTRPKSVLPNAERDIVVRFEPGERMQGQAELVLETDDPERPEVRWPLSGPARDPCSISLTPTHSKMLLGEIRTLTLSAPGTQDCRITRLFTDQNTFPFLDAPDVPFTVPAGTSIDLKVQHTSVPGLPGIPIRHIEVKESEGTELSVSVEGEPPIFGCLDVFPPRLLFEETVVGMTTRQRVTVSNSCSRKAYVTSAIITVGAYYYDVDEASFPVEVAPLSTADVWVTYAPFAATGDNGLLILNTNDAGDPHFAIDLFGTAALPTATVFPSTLDFGTVVLKNPDLITQRSECTSSSQYVQVYNDGDADLTISRLEIDGARDQVFEVVGVVIGDTNPVLDFNQPFAVPPGKDAKISLHFAPTHLVPANHENTLLIHHNAEDGPHTVTLRGKAADVGAATDTFTQLTGPKVDILWVIDDSCSMFDEQARLIGNMNQFVGYADATGADYQMAVINTDGHSPNAGKFERCFPHPAIIKGDYPDRQPAFECTFALGTNGSGREAGLAAAMNAVERAIGPNQDPVTNRNAGFVRADANLAIVIMSDEEDQSDEGDRLMRDFFLSVKGVHRPDRIRLHAIAGPVAEHCDTGERQAQAGHRYWWMTQELGGQFMNICDEDWQPLLQNLGIETFRPLDAWTLSQTADPASLVVTVDGLPVPRSTANGYVLDTTTNTIKFFGSAVPAPGATIVVNYVGLCRS